MKKDKITIRIEQEVENCYECPFFTGGHGFEHCAKSRRVWYSRDYAGYGISPNCPFNADAYVIEAGIGGEYKYLTKPDSTGIHWLTKHVFSNPVEEAIDTLEKFDSAEKARQFINDNGLYRKVNYVGVVGIYKQEDGTYTVCDEV